MAQPGHFCRAFVSELTARLGTARLEFIQAVVGPRQVGKSTGVQQILEKWPGPVVFASADSPVPYDASWIESRWREARSKVDDPQAKVILALDEIQKIRGWSEIVKKLYDEDRKKNNIRVVVLGSASLSIDHGLSESLAGRFEIIKVPHWSGYECHEAFGWDLSTYLTFGGYPAAASLIDQPDRWRRFIQDGIIEPVLSKDIFLLEKIRNPALFRQALMLALQFPAQTISYNKLIGQLQESGNASTMKHYLEVIEKAHLIKLVQRYSAQPLATRSSSPKLIPLCPALIAALDQGAPDFSNETFKGHVLEAMVGARLASSPYQVFYWSDSRHELDYVIRGRRNLLGIEVKSSSGRRRKSLHAFSRKYPKAKLLCLEGSLTESFLMSNNFQLIEESLGEAPNEPQ